MIRDVHNRSFSVSKASMHVAFYRWFPPPLRVRLVNGASIWEKYFINLLKNCSKLMKDLCSVKLSGFGHLWKMFLRFSPTPIPWTPNFSPRNSVFVVHSLYFDFQTNNSFLWSRDNTVSRWSISSAYEMLYLVDHPSRPRWIRRWSRWISNSWVPEKLLAHFKSP